MSKNSTGRPALIVTLSLLTVLSIAITAGLLLMQTREIPGSGLGSILSLLPGAPETPDADNPVIDPGSDPIGWARQGAPYPPLIEPDEQTDETPDQNPDQPSPGAAPPETPENNNDPLIGYDSGGQVPSPPARPSEAPSITRRPPAPQAPRQPQARSAPPAPPRAPAPKKPAYRDITVNAYWVQVFSSSDSSRAESIRDELAVRGFTGSVQVKEINGLPRYRVRLGAFEGKSEAEHYAETVRGIPGYESSYVVIAPVTRRVPVN